MKKLTKPIFENPTPETEKRIIETLDHLRKGWSRQKCTQWLCDKYGLSKRFAYSYIHDAVWHIQESSEILEDEADATRLIQKERLENILEATLNQRQWNTSMRAIDLINKLEGLYVEKQSLDVTVKDMQFKFGDE